MLPSGPDEQTEPQRCPLDDTAVRPASGAGVGDHDVRRIRDTTPSAIVALDGAILAAAEALCLSDLGWGDAEVEGLAPALRPGAAPQLKHILLQHNAIGPLGAETLAVALSLPALTELDLNANRLGDGGIERLARALGGSAKLLVRALIYIFYVYSTHQLTSGSVSVHPAPLRVNPSSTICDNSISAEG